MFNAKKELTLADLRNVRGAYAEATATATATAEEEKKTIEVRTAEDFFTTDEQRAKCEWEG
ncbi:hypothetical protein G6O69_17725 [Pseudenhygromyxa sp. WMMC2535]|uniref:hypothetical protein n=1 Tax=Pseudenhygromyxa sp. WMMC2535 TaxID=2712867 RepID=UPI001558103A|nr:hypothetical protein [Pseudenhygromyxa sp. WMMC2535]NVB39687.1 hypothetical protein [Pseudenhygromyxa sp. WMMC2535]